MSDKILLGRCVQYDEPIYLTKHKWDCDWYWAFGYLGNKNTHFHFEAYINDHRYEVTSHLKGSNINQNEWWVIRDLFVQAYALKKAAEVYRYGGHQSTRPGITDLIEDKTMVTRLNADLERILNVLWDFICKAAQPKEES